MGFQMLRLRQGYGETSGVACLKGITIFRTARTLDRALAGHEVVRFESVLPALTRIHDDTPITGRTVERVTAAGKHVLMRLLRTTWCCGRTCA